MSVEILPVTGLPEIGTGDDLATLLAERIDLRDGDVVVVAQKVVSKVEGMVVPVEGDAAAARVRLARAQARRTVADEAQGVLIVETPHGFVCANAGIDASNAPAGSLVLLPEDPDASARAVRRRLVDLTGADVGVVVTDTFGRPWRDGQTDVAIGVAGVACIRDERSATDRGGRPLEVTRVAVVDEIAAAADLARRKAEGVPVVVLRGLDWDSDDAASARQLLRTSATDLFPRARGRLAAALAEPELLVPLDDASLQRAIDAARTVAGHHVGFEVSDDVDAVVVRPFATDGGSDAVHAATVGLAAGLVLAALVDAGCAARLRPPPDVAVVVDRNGIVTQGPRAVRAGFRTTAAADQPGAVNAR